VSGVNAGDRPRAGDTVAALNPTERLTGKTIISVRP
jgi:hypothetical protein